MAPGSRPFLRGDKQGEMTKTHATGAAASYGARYLLKGIFNVAVGEDDRDGNPPAEERFISDEQVMELRDLIASVDAQESFFLKIMKVESLRRSPM